IHRSQLPRIVVPAHSFAHLRVTRPWSRQMTDRARFRRLFLMACPLCRLHTRKVGILVGETLHPPATTVSRCQDASLRAVPVMRQHPHSESCSFWKRGGPRSARFGLRSDRSDVGLPSVAALSART